MPRGEQRSTLSASVEEQTHCTRFFTALLDFNFPKPCQFHDKVDKPDTRREGCGTLPICATIKQKAAQDVNNREATNATCEERHVPESPEIRIESEETCLPEHILHPKPLLIVLSGPSGVGKDAALKRMKERGLPFAFVTTVTTRPKRPGEVHGKDYFFISVEEYQELLARGELLEHAEVYGNYYGVPKEQVRQALARGQDVILRIDVQGAATIKKLVPDALFIFLAASSMQELMERLVARKTETGIDLERRKETARKEMEALPMFDYVVINRDEALDEAVDQIMCIIQAEKCRVVPRHIEL